MKRIVAFSVLLLFLCTNAFAHSGRTDSSGGHKDNNNISGLGYYHYHHGKPAHLHPNGICPFEDDYLSGTESVYFTNNNDNSENVFKYILHGAVITVGVYYAYRSEKKHKEDKRKWADEMKAHDEYVIMYGGKDISGQVNMPNDTEIGDDGLPREKNSKQYWGDKYTFYTSRTGMYFHKTKGCNRHATIATHAYRTYELIPCRKCDPVIPDLSWYQDYIDIIQIKDQHKDE